MSDKSFNDQAAVLIEDAVDLIKQVLVKHSAAVLEEMHDQIVARNDRIADLEREMPLYEEIRKESRERREKLEQAEAQRDDYKRLAAKAGMEWDRVERQLAEALKLLDAVNATQWSGIECSDVDGANWFNACDKFTAALKANLDPGRPGTPHRSGGGHPVGPWPMFASPAPADIPHYKFGNVTCSQCGGEFGPGNHGFSHCENHKHLPRLG